MGLVHDLLRTFLDTAADSFAQVESAILSGNGEALVRAAHTLKSSSANVGAQALSGYYRELEKFGREGRIDEAHMIFGRVRHEHERAVREMQEILKQAA
jgi:HPt (histidine-containing phosphotransfer) domain-containing protein